jgi:transposase
MERRKFDRELKENAVKMVLKGDRTMTEVAESLGLKVWHLSNWTREYAKKGNNAFPGNGKRSPADEEIYRLRMENARLTREIEILKKATAIFARPK